MIGQTVYLDSHHFTKLKFLIFFAPKEKRDSGYFSTQDGTQIDEDYVDLVYDKINKMIESLYDTIERKLDDDSDQSLGRNFWK